MDFNGPWNIDSGRDLHVRDVHGLPVAMTAPEYEQLIAAAPAMLTAIEDLIREYEAMRVGYDEPNVAVVNAKRLLERIRG